MYIEHIIWDLEDDPDGNYWHIVVEGHGVTREEVEEVLLNKKNPQTISRSTGERLTFGSTSTGKYLAVVWNHVMDNPMTVYPMTAYPTNPPRGKKR